MNIAPNSQAVRTTCDAATVSDWSITVRVFMSKPGSLVNIANVHDPNVSGERQDKRKV